MDKPNTIRVPSFQAAQALVPFPVLALDPPPKEIHVRPESRERWATVRSLHDVDGSTIRVKQFVYDWSDVSGLPTNLVHGWAIPYAPLEVFPIGSRPAYLGKDYTGRTAGFVSHWLVHVEASNLTDAAKAPVRRLLSTTRPAIGPEAKVLASRPIPLWSWTIRSGSGPWPKQEPIFARMRWFVNLAEAHAALETLSEEPSLPEHHFDSVGVGTLPQHGEPVVCWLLRADDLHTAVALWAEPKDAEKPAYEYPKRESLPEYWEGEIDRLPLRHYFSSQTGFGLIFSQDNRRVYSLVHPPSLHPDTAALRAAAPRLFRTLSS